MFFRPEQNQEDTEDGNKRGIQGMQKVLQCSAYTYFSKYSTLYGWDFDGDSY